MLIAPVAINVQITKRISCGELNIIFLGPIYCGYQLVLSLFIRRYRPEMKNANSICSWLECKDTSVAISNCLPRRSQKRHFVLV